MEVIDNPCSCNVPRCSRAALPELSRKSFFADDSEGVLFNVESMTTFLAVDSHFTLGGYLCLSCVSVLISALSASSTRSFELTASPVHTSWLVDK